MFSVWAPPEPTGESTALQHPSWILGVGAGKGGKWKAGGKGRQEGREGGGGGKGGGKGREEGKGEGRKVRENGKEGGRTGHPQ